MSCACVTLDSTCTLNTLLIKKNQLSLGLSTKYAMLSNIVSSKQFCISYQVPKIFKCCCNHDEMGPLSHLVERTFS